MKRQIIVVLSAVAITVLLSGCGAGFMEYQARTGTPNINSCNITRYVSDDYQVLGAVKATGESSSILGMVVDGKDGQALLMEAAEAKFGKDCTGIKDVSAYKEYKAILPIIFNEVETTYIGTAVKE